MPSGDSGPQAGAAPWWTVSGTAGWASTSTRAPGSNPDRPPRGWGEGALVQAGTLLESVYWGRRVSAAALGDPR